MNKEAVLQNIKKAKVAHKEWAEKAKRIISTNETKESLLPESAHECEFGVWFHGDAQKLSSLSNNPLSCMQNIERLHKSVHDLYGAVFYAYYPQEQKSGLISKLFGEKAKKLNEDEQSVVSEQIALLESHSEEILEELSRLERRLEAVSEEKIASLGQSKL